MIDILIDLKQLSLGEILFAILWAAAIPAASWAFYAHTGKALAF